jgi:hypothetical protein
MHLVTRYKSINELSHRCESSWSRTSSAQHLQQVLLGLGQIPEEETYISPPRVRPPAPPSNHKVDIFSFADTTAACISKRASRRSSAVTSRAQSSTSLRTQPAPGKFICVTLLHVLRPRFQGAARHPHGCSRDRAQGRFPLKCNFWSLAFVFFFDVNATSDVRQLHQLQALFSLHQARLR